MQLTQIVRYTYINFWRADKNVSIFDKKEKIEAIKRNMSIANITYIYITKNGVLKVLCLVAEFLIVSRSALI